MKRRVAGLHQITEVSSTDITDVWEPTEAGLSKLEIVRHVSCISIVLCKDAVNTNSPGYQPPLPADQVKPLEGGEEEADPLVVELEARGDGIRCAGCAGTYGSYNCVVLGTAAGMALHSAGNIAVLMSCL